MRNLGSRGWLGRAGRDPSLRGGVSVCYRIWRGGGPATPPPAPEFKISADANIKNEAPALDVDGMRGDVRLVLLTKNIEEEGGAEASRARYDVVGTWRG